MESGYSCFYCIKRRNKARSPLPSINASIDAGINASRDETKSKSPSSPINASIDADFNASRDETKSRSPSQSINASSDEDKKTCG